MEESEIALKQFAIWDAVFRKFRRSYEKHGVVEQVNELIYLPVKLVQSVACRTSTCTGGCVFTGRPWDGILGVTSKDRCTAIHANLGYCHWALEKIESNWIYQLEEYKVHYAPLDIDIYATIVCVEKGINRRGQVFYLLPPQMIEILPVVAPSTLQHIYNSLPISAI